MTPATHPPRSYSDYLASRGYVRKIIQRTEKRDGDVVISTRGAK